MSDASAATALRNDILRGIKSGELSPGSQLPTEREYVATYKTSRSAVRKAIGELEAKGYLTRAVGRGTFIAESTQPFGSGPARTEHTDLELDISPADLINARLLFEPLVAELATTTATAGELEQMRRCFDSLEKAISISEYDHWDGELHLLIANSTRNAFIIRTFTVAHEIRKGSAWGKLKVKSVTPERRKVYQKDHYDIVSALVDRDGPRARTAMDHHLRNIARFLLRGDTGS